jgi:hypothetical protein
MPKVQVVIYDQGIRCLCEIEGDPNLPLHELAQSGKIKHIKEIKELPDDNNDSSGRGQCSV